MNSSTNRILRVAFATLFALVATGLTVNLIILHVEEQESERIQKVYGPLLERILEMDRDVSAMLAAARGYTLTGRSDFEAEYDEAVRSFDKTASAALQLAQEPRERKLVQDMRQHFELLKRLSDEQHRLTDNGEKQASLDRMVQAARARRTASDFAGTFAAEENIKRDGAFERLRDLRSALIGALILVSLGIVGIAAFAISRSRKALKDSIAREVVRSENVIAALPDGVMLVDEQARVVFINSAGQKLLGNSTIDVPLDQQVEVYGFRQENGRPMSQSEVPAARALGTGRPVKDVLVTIGRGSEKKLDVMMSAVPVKEGEKVTSVVVTFRDITERRKLEEEMQIQAERAQILADAGTFFTSNIDPVWVTQAIVERVAEVLGDWAAIILRVPGTTELQVAGLYHSDMASLGLAWSYMYRQPLILGEGNIGQVISSGYPSLTSNLDTAAPQESATYHATHMKLASLLVLPLRTRREIIGALVIAANDPEKQMSDQKLPLAELLAERAALAIENARLYTEQVEARRKVEDLSRLKDEFLSIASHELRTPVTSIKGYTQLARTLIHESDLQTAEEYLMIALDQIDRMSRLILELLDVSRIETGRLEIRRDDVNWPEFVREVVQHHRTAARERQLHLKLPESVAVVQGDRDRLEQVLGNLLENAVKYSPDGSDVWIEVAVDSERVITSIRDKGIGIPSDELGQVFERFHRGRHVSFTNYGGLGLGLYISKQIVERHAGTIWVESRAGQGTTFFFSLPTHKLASSDPQPTAETQPQAATM